MEVIRFFTLTYAHFTFCYQVGWMTVKEPSSSSSRRSSQRHALFLVIYAPKRGLLEVLIRLYPTIILYVTFSSVQSRLGMVVLCTQTPIQAELDTPTLKGV